MLTIIPTAPPHLHSCFWLGVQAAAFYLGFLLIMVNPGPVSRQSKTKCNSCNKTIRSNHVAEALRCSVQDCTSRCHKSVKCSRIGRYRAKTNWTCNQHQPPSDPSATTFPSPSPTTTVKRPCGRKGCKVPCRENPLHCSNCNRFFHQSFKCSGIASRAVVEQYLKPDANWSCVECTQRASQAPPTIPEFVEDSSESGKVKGTIKTASASCSIMQTPSPPRSQS